MFTLNLNYKALGLPSLILSLSLYFGIIFTSMNIESPYTLEEIAKSGLHPSVFLNPIKLYPELIFKQFHFDYSSAIDWVYIGIVFLNVIFTYSFFCVSKAVKHYLGFKP